MVSPVSLLPSFTQGPPPTPRLLLLSSTGWVLAVSPAQSFSTTPLLPRTTPYNTLPIFNLLDRRPGHGRPDGRVQRSKGQRQEEVANKKAQLSYGALDKFLRVPRLCSDASVRSRMNICFRVSGDDAKGEGVHRWLRSVFQGLMGHRSVGGMRASNAVPLRTQSSCSTEDFATAQ